nr:transposase [Verticiella sp. GG226]
MCGRLLSWPGGLTPWARFGWRVVVWLAARRLNRGSFVWASSASETALALQTDQWQALVLGLPWRHVGSAIAVL